MMSVLVSILETYRCCLKIYTSQASDLRQLLRYYLLVNTNNNDRVKNNKQKSRNALLGTPRIIQRRLWTWGIFVALTKPCFGINLSYFKHFSASDVKKCNVDRFSNTYENRARSGYMYTELETQL